MTKLQSFIEDLHVKGGITYKHIAENYFNMNLQTFHAMKKTGDITSMSIRKGLEMSKITGMSIEEMMEEAPPDQVCGVGDESIQDDATMTPIVIGEAKSIGERRIIAKPS
jgi:hypothetical protein